MFILGRESLSWLLSKQTCIACSTMEYEFVALDKAVEEAQWLQNFLEDIPLCSRLVEPICYSVIVKQQ